MDIEDGGETISTMREIRLQEIHTPTLFTRTAKVDGFSMYPRNHIIEGEVEIDKEGNILSFKLEETFTGPACVEDPYGTKEE